MTLEYTTSSVHSITVNMSQLFVNSNPDTVFDTFVGSCVAICLYDPRKKIGAMAHVMLPTCNTKQIQFQKQGKYADTAIDCMLSRMKSKGSKTDDIIAKLAGGAQMFAHESGTSFLDIGNKNILKIKELLEENKIKIKGTDLGGSRGRKIKFYLIDGKVSVESSNHDKLSI